VDKETRDKHYRIVGSLEALDRLAAQSNSMPSDTTTAALLDAIRGLTNKAVLSAWNYAEERTVTEQT
jgi:hypothetical protein